jgi:hypothetical protein
VLIHVAELVVAALEIYAVIGLVFAVCFVPSAAPRMDPGLAQAPRTVRLLIMPGVIALWPLFAWRWARGSAAPVERNAHREKAATS